MSAVDRADLPFLSRVHSSSLLILPHWPLSVPDGKWSKRLSAPRSVRHKRIVISRLNNSSGETTVSANGRSGAAVAAASLAASLNPNGTGRIS